jgi:hypothetical protein
MISGGLGEICPPIEILPEYFPAARPLGATAMRKVAGVVPLDGLTCNQLPPDVVEGDAVNETAVLPLEIATLCAAGVAVPVW